MEYKKSNWGEMGVKKEIWSHKCDGNGRDEGKWDNVL